MSTTPYEITGIVHLSEDSSTVVRLNDFGLIVDRLEALGNGSGVELSTALTMAQLQSIRSSAMRRGFNVSFRRAESGFRIYRISLRAPRKRTINPIAQDIAERFASGETLESIGREFGISRQAIEQKLLSYNTFSNLPVSERIPATNAFIAPYLAIVKEGPSCISCGTLCVKRWGGLCTECNKVVVVRTKIASRLRAYRTSGDRHYLAKAIMDIRRFSVKPEDLERA